MKYSEFKKQLDKYFKPDDEIYPHGSSGCVTFYHIYHGQSCVTVEKVDDCGIVNGATVIAVHPTGKQFEGDIV